MPAETDRPSKTVLRAAKVATVALAAVSGLAAWLVATPARAQPAAGKPGASASAPAAPLIRHEAKQRVDLDCARREVPAARASGTGQQLDTEQLLLQAVKGKPMPKEPLQSLAWMDMALRQLGYTASVTEVQGPTRMALMRIASLVDNDYTVAAQMAYGLHSRQRILSGGLGEATGRLVLGMTESSDQTPEVNHTNLLVDQAFERMDGLRPVILAYGRWAVRGYAYDDLVAIDAALAGVCMSQPTGSELQTLRRAIEHAQYDPKRDYRRTPVASR